MDNIGSVGMQMALVPLCYNQYVLGPIMVGDTGSLSIEAYKWISCLYVFDLIPGLVFGFVVTSKLGQGGACVLGNLLTAVFQLALLVVGIRMDSTTGSLALFLVLFFIGYPMTILSQLTTGPQLFLAVIHRMTAKI